MSRFDVGDVVVAIKDIVSFTRYIYAREGDTATVISSKDVTSLVQFDHNNRRFVVDNSSVRKINKRNLDRKITVEVKRK